MNRIGIGTTMLGLLLGLAGCTTQDQAPRGLTLYATQYHVHQAASTNDPGAVPLLGETGAPLGVALALRDWCDAAMEGTVTVSLPGGGGRTFNFARAAGPAQADCTSRFPRQPAARIAALNASRFAEVPADAPFGLGARASYRLVPYRSAAVDPSVIPLGSVLFIPGLAGAMVTLPDGQPWRHDGYLMAVDVGGAIRGNHIDIFTGVARGNPAPAIITSDAGKTFPARLETDATVVETLRHLHTRP